MTSVWAFIDEQSKNCVSGLVLKSSTMNNAEFKVGQFYATLNGEDQRSVRLSVQIYGLEKGKIVQSDFAITTSKAAN